ncbi:MAG: PorT family protein [Flavobacteriales bacterium]|nr:PorT family protein [Flavobacteriales bacterium]
MATNHASLRTSFFWLAMLLYTGLSAQDTAQVLLERHGPKLGIGMASIRAGGSGGSGLPKFGPLGGWSVEFPLSRRVGLLLEPMAITKGGVTVNNVLRTRSDVSLLYLEVPLMLKLSLKPEPQGTYLAGGLMYGYMVRGRVRNFYDGQEVSEENYSTAAGRSQLSVGLGFGYEKRNWLLELRGQSSTGLLSPIVTANNVVISFQVAWRFPERKKKEKTEEEEDGEEEEEE